ncbi:hypothetical protein NQ315_001421 [Exocentrus adspersus]|uniref:Fibronectin type-III domain-containing protein n=1 Tax=Exocentrus adspersus TaxID=1586481 RepID=A0AAV8WGN4_9CUCU|nr:hypothetical protein NQ315_001421 [Exocentrus adspersus]
MIFRIFLFLLLTCLVLLEQVYEDDDCDSVDLRLANFLFITESNKTMTISWRLINQTDCPVAFHLTVVDTELGVVEDVILDDNSTSLASFSPCTEHHLTLRAISKDVEGPNVTAAIWILDRGKYLKHIVMEAPILKTLEVKATSINMTWTLEGNANRCLLKTFHVQGPYVNVTVPLQDLEDKAVVSVQLQSLKPNSMYYFNVTVENSGGVSPATQMAVQTPELSDNRLLW